MGRDVSNLLVNSIHDRELRRAAEEFISGRLLDIGCGEKPYEALLAPFVSWHIGIDHPATLHDPSRIDTFATAYAIPFPDSCFDAAVCTAVLEHLEEPAAAIRECFRVLKPGGAAIYTVPFIWHVHEEPRDFYRFSKFGLAYLFQNAGFEMVRLMALSGFWVTFGQLLVYNLFRFNKGPIRWLHLLDLPGLFVQAVAFVLDRLDKSERWTWMYLVAARKPGPD